MSQGIFIKGFTIQNANGTYTLLSNSTFGINRIWDSVDHLFRLKYRALDPEFRLTTDTVFDVNKTYYKFINGEYVVDQETHGRADDIPPDVYYERFNVGQWEIVPLTGENSGTPVFVAALDDETIDPYHPGVVWEDADGVKLSTAGVDYWDESSFTTSVSDPVVDEVAGTVTTVITTTNLVSGEVYRETNVVRTKEVYVQTPLVRYDNMNLSVGRVYRFQFVSDFEVIGYKKNPDGSEIEGLPLNAGIFKLEKVMPYFDLVAAGIDLYANLYQRLGIKKDVYASDQTRLTDSLVYKLSDPTDSSIIIYMPQIFIKDADPSVDKYSKVLLTIDLGIHADLTQLSDMESILKQVFEKKYGIVPEPSEDPDKQNALVELTEYDHIWLATSQMDKIEEERRNIANASRVSFATLFDLQNTNQIFIENRRLKGMVAHLEEALKTRNNNSR